jgi:hypothetical protein
MKYKKNKANFGATVADTEAEQSGSSDFVAEEMATPANFEEVEKLDYNYALKRRTVREILQAEEAQELTPEEADDFMAQALEDCCDREYEALGVEAPVMDEGGEEMPEGEYSSGDRYANFASSRFGQVLASLINQEYEDPDEGVLEVAEAAGLSGQDILDIVAGNAAVPPVVLDGIAGLFDTLQANSQAYKQFIELGSQAYGELEAEEQPELATASMSAADMELRAEFAAMQEREAIATNLRQYERKAEELLNKQYLTLAEKRLLLGNTEFSTDFVNTFAEFCQEAQVRPSDQLDRIGFYLHVAEKRGPIAQFGQRVEPVFNVDEELAKEAEETAKNYRQRKGYN